MVIDVINELNIFAILRFLGKVCSGENFCIVFRKCFGIIQ